MSNVIQFDFGQTYKEIEIGDKTYKMDMNDDAQDRIGALIAEAQELAKKAQDQDTEKMSVDELQALREEQKDLGIKLVDAFLGEGTGEELYEVAGRSTVNMMKLVRKLQELFEEFMGESYEQEKKKFVKKGK